ncbi:manganese ABC transporter ATP-binding protein [Anaerobacillus arseniciselenatis]|uniref:Manganese ABC transporter ATP-binding protein n=1 Tax=Anaerobacillus arseniciselenatis TaxID=85682 RepID=A0A1S2LUW7_9BACI|nr:metal ABC transporter ATP-binding protein [Anaerobacillus arseniciselenatis]OIJ16124.1 manganese ABC transporter ATP-binding protein [Anaerobacillus arseniciselenatis]
MTANQPEISVERLSVNYGGHHALKNISFGFQRGQLIGIIGPNGAGKSTLIKAIMGLEKFAGKVEIFGKSIKQMRKKISYVPQRSSIDFDFPVIVEDVVLMGRYAFIPWYKKASFKDKQIAKDALEQVGMTEFAKRQIGQLSGGQQQRVFIARALAQQADVFFLDEPFVGIDATSENIIVDLLRQLQSEGKTIFVVHHDLSKVEKYFDHLLILNQELVGAGKVADVYKPEILSKAYKGSITLFDSNDNMMVVSN